MRRPETDVVYHNTPIGNRESILRHGLCLRYSETSLEADEEGVEAGAIFFSAKRLPDDPRFDTWEVSISDLPDLVEDQTTDQPDPEDSWWMVHRDVPPEVLRLSEPEIEDEPGFPAP